MFEFLGDNDIDTHSLQPIFVTWDKTLAKTQSKYFKNNPNSQRWIQFTPSQIIDYYSILNFSIDSDAITSDIIAVLSDDIIQNTHSLLDSLAVILNPENEVGLAYTNRLAQLRDNEIYKVRQSSFPQVQTEDIENELVKNVTSLLMELGTGFAFMGQQYHLEVGGKDFYIDLLFYNTKLRCYVAIDLKTGEFKPEQAGKMNFYLSALDDLVKAPEDNPSVGLILCRDENRTIAEYALRDMSKPIGVSEYHLCTDLPLDLKNALPAVEDIRSRIDMKK